MLRQRSLLRLCSFPFSLKLGFPNPGAALHFDFTFVSFTKLTPEDFIMVSYRVHVLSQVCVLKSKSLVDILLIPRGRIG